MLLGGIIELPCQEEMLKSIATQEERLSANSCKTHRASLFLRSDYRDHLASIIGKTPSLLKLILCPRLLIEYYLGPITWAGYNIYHTTLGPIARQSLKDTCRRAWGQHWYLKVQCAVVVAATGAVAMFCRKCYF